MNELIALDLIKPNPYQPRTTYDQDYIASLAASIADDGLLQEPKGRRVNGHVELAFGHNRYEAFKLLFDLQEKLEKSIPIPNEPDTPLCRAVVAADIAYDNGARFYEMPIDIIEIEDETMYRHAVVENLQRKDLNPIEEAKAMQRAMQDFNYNSRQVGELFGKSASTVRGTIRLLDLDDDFQKKLATGEMTVGAARKLLAMQKVMTPEAIEKLKEDSPRTVDEIVFGQIDDAYGVGAKLLRMHTRWQHSEPKGGDDLWPLNWTYETPPYSVPTEKQFAKLWEGEKERNRRKVSTIAMELASTITAINPAIKKTWQELYASTKHLDVLDFLKQLMEPPPCSTGCDFYIKQDGNHYCGFKACHANKVERWVQTDLKRLSAEWGIPVYNRSQDGKEIIRMDSNYTDQYKKWWDAKNPDMRLMVKKSAYSHSFTNHHVICVVMTGETARKAIERESQKKKTGLSYNEVWAIKREIREKIENSIYRFVFEQAAPEFATVLEGLSKGTLAYLQIYSNFPDWVDEDKVSPTIKVAFTALRHKAISNVISDMSTKETITPVKIMAKYLTGVAKAWGIKLPSDWMQIADGYEPEGLQELYDKLKEGEEDG